MRTLITTGTRFRHTRIRTGYAPDEVDAFVETVEDALRSPTPLLGAGDVASCQFTPVVLKTGYHMGDVDDYLSEAEHLLSAREGRA